MRELIAAFGEVPPTDSTIPWLGRPTSILCLVEVWIFLGDAHVAHWVYQERGSSAWPSSPRACEK